MRTVAPTSRAARIEMMKKMNSAAVPTPATDALSSRATMRVSTAPTVV
jgi:hypothetical protein